MIIVSAPSSLNNHELFFSCYSNWYPLLLGNGNVKAPATSQVCSTEVPLVSSFGILMNIPVVTEVQMKTAKKIPIPLSARD
jgi:hypothetical protein